MTEPENTYTLRSTLPDGTASEILLTPDQAADLVEGRPVAFAAPQVPDVLVDDDGTIIEREDARP